MKAPKKARGFKSPLSIYVVFHPKSREARGLADRLHDWFRLKTDDGERSESGLPIWYRCALTPEPELDGGVEPPPQTITPAIDWAAAEHSIVVVLGDRQLVADRIWRHALEKLHHEVESGREEHGAVLLPVEMDVAIHQLGFLTAARNVVRIGAAVPPRVAGDGEDPVWERLVDERARLLRRAVTESIARELLGDRQDGAEALPKRMTVFVSHAKRDGLEIAEKLRDSLASYGQLQVWFDANDLPPGYAWAPPMRQAAGELAALVSVVTDAYPTRPWCRAEVEVARKPRRIALLRKGAESVDPEAPDTRTSQVSVWRVRPTVAVHRAGAMWSRAMAPLVHVPAIGWDEQADAATRRLGDVADRLVLEIMVAVFQQKWALQMVDEVGRSELSPHEHVVMLTFVPEPWALVHIVSELLSADAKCRAELLAPLPLSERARKRRSAARKQLGQEKDDASERPVTEVAVAPLSEGVERIWIAYPGHGLRPLERAELQRVADALARLRWGKARLHDDDDGSRRIELISQERFPERLSRVAEDAEIVQVCLSGGGDADGLARDGVGMPHVDDLFVLLARRLLEAGCRLVYGGSLGVLDNNLTRTLMETARCWVRDSDALRDVHLTGNHDGDASAVLTAKDLDEPPLVNYSPWPSSEQIGLEHDADYVGVCRFVRVLPAALRDPAPKDMDSFTDPLDPRDSIDQPRLGAEALQEMRRITSTPHLHPLRIVVGGKISGFSGWLPGIAAEVLAALSAGQVPVILGGFGGCASLLGEFLAESRRSWPKELTFEERRHDKKLSILCAIGGDAAEVEVKGCYDTLKAQMEVFRDVLQGGGDPFGKPSREAGDDRIAREANAALFGDQEFRGLLKAMLRERSPTEVLRGTMAVLGRVRAARSSSVAKARSSRKR